MPITRLIIFIFIIFFITALSFIALHTRLFFVEGASMEPTFIEQGFVITNSLIYRLHTPKRGDSVVFQYPYATGKKITYNIKRIVGLPNEIISITGTTVHIKNTHGEENALSEPYVQIMGENRHGSATLSADEYFMMSDNRSEKADSRTWGALKKTFIVGPVIFHSNGKFLYSLFNRLDELRK